MWQAVFFDFDGVIIDSVDIKTRAFAEMFKKYGPEVERQVISYHLVNEGISRFEKFRLFYADILNEELSQKELNNLGLRFSQLVLEEVLRAPYVSGALETLKQLKESNIPAYVVSGTPHDEINYIVENKKLKSYFREVHGSPRSKQEIIEDIILRKNYDRSLCLFIGDAMTDYNASKATGIQSLGIIKSKQNSPFPQGTMVSTTVTTDLTLFSF